MHKDIFAVIARPSIVMASIFIASIFMSQLALASSGDYRKKPSAQHKVDKQYELGKSYYRAAQADGTRLEYCVKDGDSLTKISRRSVKPFKSGLVSNFTDSLYSCADPSMKIFDVVANDQSDAILYYLNKRFKLRLKQNS